MAASLHDIASLQLVLTAACNLRCSYCYQTNKHNRRIEWDVVRPALDRLLTSTRSDVQVLFIGGEPLLEFPTIEQAVAYLHASKRPDMNIRLALITNGLLLGEREIQFLVKHRFYVKVSFDGVPAAQAERGLHTFGKLNALLDDLRDRYPAFYDQHLTVNLVVLPETIRYVARSVAYFVLEKRVQDLSIGAQFTTVHDWAPERIHELERAFAAIYRICLKRYRQTGEVPLQVFRKTATSRTSHPTAMAMCGVGRGDQLAVDINGQAHGCVTFVESYQTFPTMFLRSRVEAMRLGDIRDPTFETRLRMFPDAVRSAEIFDHKEQKYSSYARCGDCKFIADCDVCPMSIGRIEGESDPRRIPDFNCAYNLVSLKYREKFPRMRPLAEAWTGPSTSSIGRPPGRKSLNVNRTARGRA